MSATGCSSPATYPERRAAPRAPEGLAREGDPPTLRRRRSRDHARVGRRLQGHDRRPARRRRHDPAPAGDPAIRRRRPLRRRGSRGATGSRRRASRSSPSPSCTIRRPPPARSGWCSQSLATRPGTSVSDLPAGVRVHTEYPELTRRFLEKNGVDARGHALVRRHRGQDPRDRRRGRGDHRDRPRAARRGPAGARHDPRLVHRADRQPDRARRRRQAPRHGTAADVAARCARSARPGAR